MSHPIPLSPHAEGTPGRAHGNGALLRNRPPQQQQQQRATRNFREISFGDVFAVTRGRRHRSRRREGASKTVPENGRVAGAGPS